MPGMLFFAIGVTVVAFIAWNHSLHYLGLARTVVWMNAVPAVELVVSMCLGHRVPVWQLCGLALVLAGVFMVQTGESWRSKRAGRGLA